MYPYLEAIRKIARYTPQAWGGSMGDVQAPKGKAYDMPLSFGAPMAINKGIAMATGEKAKRAAAKAAGKAIGKTVAQRSMMPVYEATSLAIQAAHGQRKVEAATQYGARLGKSNPYLASSL